MSANRISNIDGLLATGQPNEAGAGEPTADGELPCVGVAESLVLFSAS